MYRIYKLKNTQFQQLSYYHLPIAVMCAWKYIYTCFLHGTEWINFEPIPWLLIVILLMWYGCCFQEDANKDDSLRQDSNGVVHKQDLAIEYTEKASPSFSSGMFSLHDVMYTVLFQTLCCIAHSLGSFLFGEMLLLFLQERRIRVYNRYML